jgi:nicotinamidase-related amidase
MHLSILAESPRTALIEVDFQHWIIELAHDREVVARAARTRSELRRSGVRVVCTRYLSLDANDPRRSDPGGFAASFHPDLAPAPGDLVLSKHERDIFANPDLAANLRLLGITDLVVTGITTDHGVALAARSARALGYRTTVVAAACAGTSVSEHDRTLDALADDGIVVI